MPTRKIACCSAFNADNLTRIETPDEYHKAKLVCGSCGKWYKFDTSSENKQRLADRQQVINQIKDNPQLSDKQKAFLQSIYSKVHITPAQFTYFENLKTKLLVLTTPPDCHVP